MITLKLIDDETSSCTLDVARIYSNGLQG